MENFKASGSCVCKEVAYEISDEPLFMHACHCTQCQRRTGSAFGTSVVVLVNDFAVTKGSLQQTSFTLASGALVGSYACPTCRVAQYLTFSTFPGILFVPGGTLDDPGRFPPQAHIYTKTKQAWINIPEGVPVFEEMYELETVWPQASLQRLAEAG